MTTEARPLRAPGLPEGWPLVGWAALAVAALVAGVLASQGTGEAGIRAVIRATARSSLTLFVPVFAASSLRALWRSPASAWLLRNRRYLGVSFAVSHAFHLAGIVALATGYPDSFYEQVAPSTLVGGGIGYGFVAAMTATSSDAAVRWLGPRRWRWLHRTGIWILFGIFTASYLPRAFASAAYAPAALALLGALALRIAAFRRRRSRGRGASGRSPSSMEAGRKIALGLLVLFALQAGASAAAAAHPAACCPEMAKASREAPAPPCHALSPVGCCEEKAASSSPPSVLPPAAPAGPALGVAAAVWTPAALPARALPAEAARRALASTVLRL
jgi:sulfoxide reductase heme-binding subunit YedZ